MRGPRGKMMTPPPPLLSIPRLTTLFASLLVAIASGTNYVYSAYSPQLGAKLGISHTQLNIVALAGNLGVYITSPIWGKIVDKRGPRILLAWSCVIILTGYLGMRYFYDSGLPDGVNHLPPFSFALLTLCSYLTGVGAAAGDVGAINATAKTFPDKARASATGLVISGFGLSAFLFNTIAHVFFPGDTSSFLLLLALGTSIPMVIGFFFIRPIPLPQEKPEAVEDEGVLTTLLPQHDHPSGSHLLNHDIVEPSSELLTGQEVVDLPNLHLFKNPDFWLLCSILTILSGTGIMYINNVGSMSSALYAHETSAAQYDPSTATSWQAAQVSTISISSFLGRIFIGLFSDFVKHNYGLPRSYCLTLISIMFFLSQLLLISITSVSSLWTASLLLGWAYGSLFSLFPTVCLEWFGMPHFSENWGYMCLSPIFAGNLFSLIFGSNLDRNSRLPSSPSSSNHTPLNPTLSPSSTIATLALSYLTRYVIFSPSSRILPRSGPESGCLSGSQCYISTIYLTTLATFSAIILSVYAGHRDRLREMKTTSAMRRKTASSETAATRCSEEEGGGVF